MTDLQAQRGVARVELGVHRQALLAEHLGNLADRRAHHVVLGVTTMPRSTTAVGAALRPVLASALASALAALAVSSATGLPAARAAAPAVDLQPQALARGKSVRAAVNTLFERKYYVYGIDLRSALGFNLLKLQDGDGLVCLEGAGFLSP